METLDATEEEELGVHVNPPDTIIRQFTNDVRSFSSQYGSDISISYTAYNICGKPSKYPSYGDFPQTFVMRTYGKWWNAAPSRRIDFMTQNYPQLRGHDYIDITFEQRVIPLKVCIYETYHPGSVVRIWAKNDNLGSKRLWKLLWEGKSDMTAPVANVFSPPIKSVNFNTKCLRLEFDHSELNYYTEIDAVSLTGIKEDFAYRKKLLQLRRLRNGSTPIVPIPWLMKPYQTETSDVIKEIFLRFLHEDYPRFVQSMNSLSYADDNDSNDPNRRNNGIFALLPDETVLKIFSYLDFASLLRCARVNKYFNSLVEDQSLYTSLNLQPYWYAVDEGKLTSLASRCKRLQKLDISWCGLYGMIEADAFCQFIKDCGQHLTHIRLDCCEFVNDECIIAISSICDNLQEITLHNCTGVKESGFSSLAKLNHLERLELYRTFIEAESLIKILKASPNLKHLNLGSCCRILSMDEVAQALGVFNKQLISVDFWKTYSLTPIGIKALSHCHLLQEIDIGWCLGVSIPGDCFSSLAAGCPHLRKLFLGSLRGVMDKDLYPFLYDCPKLEQIDLLGNRNVTIELFGNILNACKNLKFIDVSFCEQIGHREVEQYRRMFPKVEIKFSSCSSRECCAFPNHF